jgi:hypothetical protein
LLMRAISQELPLTVVNRSYVLFNKKNWVWLKLLA